MNEEVSQSHFCLGEIILQNLFHESFCHLVRERRYSPSREGMGGLSTLIISLTPTLNYALEYLLHLQSLHRRHTLALVCSLRVLATMQLKFFLFSGLLGGKGVLERDGHEFLCGQR